MRQNARGVSLIEVMVVVALLVIVTVSSIPSFTAWSANARVRAAAEAMQNGMRLAQAEGVRANARVTLRLTDQAVPGPFSEPKPNGVNWIVLNAQNDVLQQKGREGVVDVSMTPTDGRNGTVNGFNGNIAFTGLGQNDLSAPLYLNFDATGAERPLTVILTPGGRVRMCDPKRPSGDAQACE